MTLYSLTEAYSEIYDHRKVEDLFDNLRFVDYLQDEDIQEVVEELVWEFRDYGNTLEEAFEMLDHAVTVPVLYESYDELIGDVLYEASRVDMASRIQARKQYMKDSEKAASQARATGRANQRAARISSAKQAVKSKLSGPISSVKQSISGAAGGIGRAAKKMGGAVVERGKSLLKSLLRRGGKALTSAGRSIEGSGKAAAAAPVATRTARVGPVTITKDPGGKKRQMVGRAVRKVGVALQKKAGKAPEPKPMLALPAKTSGQPAVQRTVSARKQEAAKKIAKAAEGSTARGTRFAGPGASLSAKRTKTGYKEGLAKFASQLSEQDYNTLVDYILEDMISEGYASDVLEALDLFESLTEDSVIDIALEYFND